MNVVPSAYFNKTIQVPLLACPGERNPGRYRKGPDVAGPRTMRPSGVCDLPLEDLYTTWVVLEFYTDNCHTIDKFAGRPGQRSFVGLQPDTAIITYVELLYNKCHSPI